MFTRLVSAAAVALSASTLVAAQTSTLCDPTKKSCPADGAVGSTVTIDFTKGQNDFFSLAEGTTLKYDNSLGAVFSIGAENEAPTITSKNYIFFGKVDVTVRAALGTGIVTSFVLQSDDLDEIDWEWLGADDGHVQTNYFSKGNTSTYDRGGTSAVSNSQEDFHTYTVDWNSDRINWQIDGTTVRTLNYKDANGGATYPQTPMQVKLGTWCAGGKNSPAGTVQWAGGYTDFSKGPFLGYYQKVVVQDYSNGVTGAKSYSYGDMTGTYGSIKVDTVNGAPSVSASAASATIIRPSSTIMSSGSATGSAATTMSTMTSSGSGSGTATTTGSGSSQTTSGSGFTTGSSTSSSPSSTATAKSGASKSGFNIALLGVAAFAYFAL